MVLLMALIVRSRFREIGILKAIGARNRNVLGQFATETVVLSFGAAILALALSLATGSLIADQFKSAASTTSASDDTPDAAANAQPGGFVAGGGPGGGGRAAPGAFGQLGGLATGSTGATDEEIDAALDSVDFTISPSVLGLAFGAALLVALAGMAVPTFSVLRMRPADVLRFEA
jgi:putative ABC transport system permease protein